MLPLDAATLEGTAEAEGRRRPRPKVAGPTVLGSANERCRGKRDTFVYNQLEELAIKATRKNIGLEQRFSVIMLEQRDANLWHWETV